MNADQKQPEAAAAADLGAAAQPEAQHAAAPVCLLSLVP